MIIRDLQNSDLEKIDIIYKKYHNSDFGIPDISNTISLKVAEKDGQLVAFGMAKLVPELILVLDKSFPLKTKALALKEMIATGLKDCISFEQVHAFSPDIEYVELLKKHFNFVEIRDKSLVLNLE